MEHIFQLVNKDVNNSRGHVDVNDDSEGTIDDIEFILIMYVLCGFGDESGGSAAPEHVSETTKKFSRRQRINRFCEDPDSSLAARIWTIFIICAIFVSCIIFTLTTEQYFSEQPWKSTFDVIEAFCVIIFTLEYLVRFAVADNKLLFLIGFMNIIDLVSVIPWYIELPALIEQTTPEGQGGDILRILRLFRVVRVVKIGRYLQGLQMFARAMLISIPPMSMAYFVILILIVLFASFIHGFEIGNWDDETQSFITADGGTR